MDGDDLNRLMEKRIRFAFMLLAIVLVLVRK